MAMSYMAPVTIVVVVVINNNCNNNKRKSPWFSSFQAGQMHVITVNTTLYQYLVTVAGSLGDL